MSVSQAAIDLVFRARNLADAGVADLTGSLAKVGDAGAKAAGRFAGAFEGIGEKLANGIGNATETLASGGSVGEAALQLGIYMGGQLAESLAGSLLEHVAESGLVATLTAPLTAMGTAMGGILAAAVPIGIAALPFILIGALVAAITVLIVNPEIRGKVFDFVGGLVGHIGDALRTGLGILGDVIPKAFATAFGAVITAVPQFIGQLVDFWMALPQRIAGLGFALLQTIVGGLIGLPGRIAGIIGDAFRSIHLDIGPFHITGSGVTVDLPHIDLPHFATGVTGFRGGLAVVGERGPELVRLPAGSDVIPNGRAAAAASSSASSGVTIHGVSEREILDMVDRGLYFRLRQAGIG